MRSMSHLGGRLLVPGLLALLACTSGKQAVPAEQELATSAAATPESEPPRFSIAVVHDGRATLHDAGERAYLLVDGAPLLLGDKGPISGGLALSALGDAGEPDFHPVAFAETRDRSEAWLVAGRGKWSAGPYRAVDMAHRDADGWAELRLGSEPGLLEFYVGFFQRGDALLGLRVAEFANHGDDEARLQGADSAAAPEIDRARLQSAFDRAPRGFVQLAGPAVATLPEIPDGWDLADVEVDGAGTIYALAQHGEIPEWIVLFAWPLDRSEPDTIEPPPLVRKQGIGISVTDHCVLLSATPRTLALLRGTHEWEPIEIDLPLQLGDRLHGPALCIDAASSDRGSAVEPTSPELWLTLNRADGRRTKRLVHRSASGAWSVVELPAPTELVPEQSSGVRVQPGYAEPPNVDGLVWAEGRLWVSADFGELVDPGTGADLGIRRQVVHVLGPLEHAPMLLSGTVESPRSP